MTGVKSTKNVTQCESEQKKEDILDLVGGDGPWQRRIFLVILIIAVPLASHNLVMSFFAPDLDHWCARPPGTNLTVAQWKSIAIPPRDPHCSRYEFLNHTGVGHRDSNHSVINKVVSCDKWEYDDTFYGSTVMSQWNLVCDDDWLISMSKSIFTTGYLISVILFGYLSDKFGRRPFIAICNLIALTSAVIGAFSVSFLMFSVSRFFIAVGVAGAFNTSFVLLLEIISPEYRSFYGVAINFGWCFGYVTLPGIAWLIRDWFWIQIVITIPCVLLIPVWWWVPESPRWLLAKGDTEGALEVLMAAGKANKKSSEDIRDKLKEAMYKTSKVYENDDSIPKVLRLLWISGLWKRTLIVFYLWFVISFVYYGLSFNTNELAGNPFVNFAVSGAMEIPANILTIFVIRSVGRRNPLAISLSVAGIACLFMYILPEDPWWSSVVVSMIGKFFITCSFTIVYVVTAEVFPTTVRNISIGSASMCARFGSVIAPFVRELGNATHPIVPQVLFGIIAIIGGILILFLPETNNKSVPDTMEEAAYVAR